VRHLRPPRPIRFPAEEEVPEGIVHLRVRTFLWQLLAFALGPEHTVGSDQFVYWNGAEPKRCLSPDVFVRLGVPQTLFDSWKSWERGGAPELAVEIISPNEGDGVAWETKLARYHELGVRELVRFDPGERIGARLRAWDRVEGDLVERVVEHERTSCVTLGLTWVLAPIDPEVTGLRLADAEGRLLASKEETLASERADETRSRHEAEARVRELEEKVRLLGG